MGVVARGVKELVFEVFKLRGHPTHFDDVRSLLNMSVSTCRKRTVSLSVTI